MRNPIMGIAGTVVMVCLSVTILTQMAIAIRDQEPVTPTPVRPCSEMFIVSLPTGLGWACDGECVGYTGACSVRSGVDEIGPYEYCACDLSLENECCHLVRRNPGTGYPVPAGKGSCGDGCPGTGQCKTKTEYILVSYFPWIVRRHYSVCQ